MLNQVLKVSSGNDDDLLRMLSKSATFFWIFDFLGNDTKRGRRYCGTRIGTRMRSIEWCHFLSLWVTPNLYLKIMILFNVKLDNNTRQTNNYNGRLIGSSIHEFGHKLLIYRLMRQSMTFNNPWRRFQVQAIIRRWISQKPYKIQT